MVSQVSNTIRKLQSPGRYAGLRRGVTIIEVLFATGIAITGLLGVASLLLMAGRQASQANRSLETQTLADDWYNEFTTRGMNRPENWIWYQDLASFPNASPRWIGFSKSQTGSTFSTGSRGGRQIRPAGKTAVCIDPYFFSDRNVRAALPPSGPYTPSGLWYRPSVFPYYEDGFNPLVDSDFAVGDGRAQPWTDQPRMRRVSLGQPGQILSEKHVETLFASQGELTTLVSEEDKTIPAIRGFLSMPSPADASIPIVAKGSNRTQYSWLATLSPLEQSDHSSEEYYTLSLVTMYQRDRLVSAIPRGSASTPSVDTKPQGERLTWVVPLSGNFYGGSGGRVRLIASVATDDSVGVGDWIMLSKHVSGNSVTFNGNPAVEAYSVFRWYRIIAADAEATVSLPGASDPSSDPWGNTPQEAVWSREVVLDGPDWNFTPIMAGVGLPAPTTGTLVKGAIAVHERVIEVPDPGDF